ncbi:MULTISPECIES: hypothetical protein [unclassified Luteococcus]|uniref:hypothetical protein n=1 Tax=unclassified Luteococcus TaxID=2639923 RepID=UPI00313AACFC
MTFPWAAELWQPSDKARRATRKGQVYGVRVAVEPPGLRDELWRLMAEELTSQGEVLLDGGTALHRLDSDSIELVSGGEDVLDSLSWSINQTLTEAAAKLGAEASFHLVGEGEPSAGQRDE